MVQQQIRELYYNAKQLLFLAAMTGIRVFQGGRGSGKTRCIPEDILQRAKNLPRAKIALIGFTLDQINESVLADCREVFELHGLVEGIHYVINERPPEHFVKPYKRIENYSNSISFWNGFAVAIYSMAKNAKKIRSKSFDGVIVDEALNIKGSDFNSIVMPTLRGEDHWSNNPYWKMISIYSSYPRNAEGSWFLKYKKRAKLYAQKYTWVEATFKDNIVVVGEEYGEMMRQVLSFVDYKIEMENESDNVQLPDRFYHKFKDQIHTYHTALYADTCQNESLDLSFDFGGRYSCVIVSQTHEYEERFLNEFDTNNLTEEEQADGKVKKLADIVEDFCTFYRDHQYKHVNIYGDGYGLNQNPSDELNYYQQIIKQFEELDWTCTLHVEIAKNPPHKTRHTLINDLLSEKNVYYPKIRINAELCTNLIVSITHARIKDDFKKDKSDERNPDFDQSLATHLSDAADYIIHDKYGHLIDDETFIGSGYGGGIDTVG